MRCFCATRRGRACSAALDRARTTFEAARVEKRPARRPALADAGRGGDRHLPGRRRSRGRLHPSPPARPRSPAATNPAATPDGWRAVVAEYLTLYTRDTLANLPDDRSLHEAELKSVGDKLALGLSVDKVALDGLALKRSQLFNLDGRPLAQIAYLTSDDGPVAFCIIADAAKDQELSFEERRGRNIVYWSKRGHAFMLIGNLSRSTLETLAASLAARIA